MNEQVLEHYLSTGTYTYAGPYKEYFETLPEDIESLSRLICAQIIHRVTLRDGNTKANIDMIYGDMTKFPWYRLRCEDDIFLTAVSMTAELFRMDERGFRSDREVQNKIVVCCRYVSVLMAAILKAKGIPCRCRAGFAPYLAQGISMDHWINQYWDADRETWITFDADGFWDASELGFDPYHIPTDKFDWAASVWTDIRSGKTNGSQYIFADVNGTNSLEAAARYLMYDFHAIMNDEITFSFQPYFLDQKFGTLSEEDYAQLDELAYLMESPDENYSKLKNIWENNRKFRIINSPLVGDQSNNYGVR